MKHQMTSGVMNQPFGFQQQYPSWGRQPYQAAPQYNTPATKLPASGHKMMSLIFNNDVHEKLDKMPRVITGFNALARMAEQQGRDVFKLNSGDNNISAETSEWNLNVLLNNMVGFHAVVPGNHELDLGTENYAKGLRLANFTTMAGNFKLAPQSELYRRVFEGKFQTGPQVVRSGNSRLGVIGLITPRVHEVLNPRVNLNGLDVADEDDTVKIAQQQAEQLKSQNVDLTVIAAHIGVDDCEKMVKRLRGIDGIIAGHDHKVLTEIRWTKDKDGKPVWIVELGKNGELTGVLDIVKEASGRSYPQRYQVYNNAQFQPNAKAEALKNAVLGVPKPVAYVSTPYDSTNNPFEPDAVAEFAADAIRKMANADIAFVRSSEIRDNIQPGILTDHDIKALMPFSDPIVRLNLTGRQIWESLEESAEGLAENNPHPGMLHPSGLRVTMHRKTGEISNVLIYDRQSGQWQPIQKNKSYSVALGEFGVTNRAEFEDMAHPEWIHWNSHMPLRDVFTWGLQQAGAFNRPIAFKTDGRLRIV